MWSDGRSIDDRLILQFSDVSENEVVEVIRVTYQYKVLILNQIISPFPQNPNLTIGNLEEDQAAIRYYTEDAHQETAFKRLYTLGGTTGIALAQVFMPHFHRRHFPEIIYSHRPYEDHLIILVNLNATKMELIHEFLHAYLYDHPKPAELEIIEGIAHDPICSITLRLQDLRVKMEDKKKAYDQIASGPYSSGWRLRSYGEFMNALLDYWDLRLKYQFKIQGEELDIHRLLMTYAKQVHLTDLSFKLMKETFTSVVVDNRNLLEALNTNEDFNFFPSVAFRYPVELRLKFNAVVHFLSYFAAKHNQEVQWLNTLTKS